MRKLTEEAIKKFYAKRTFKKSNTEVKINSSDGSVELLLFGNSIIQKHSNDKITIKTCGWNSDTTLERLNGLKEIHVIKRKNILTLKLLLFNETIIWNGNEIIIN